MIECRFWQGAGRFSSAPRNTAWTRSDGSPKSPLIRESLWNRIRRDGKVHLLAPARIDQVELRRDRNRLVLDDGKTLTTSLLVAADGARSRLRQLAGIKVDEWHYNQSALVAPIATENANTGLAWQRFTKAWPTGPAAAGRWPVIHCLVAGQRTYRPADRHQ